MRLNLLFHHNPCRTIVVIWLLINVSCKNRNAVWRDTLTRQINQDSNHINPLDTSLFRFMVDYHIPALSITVSKDDKIVYAKTFGLANLSSGEEANNENLFRIDGISTCITSLAIRKLVGMRQISYDSKVFGKGSILGTRYGDKPYGPLLTEITVADLFNHTCGGWSGADDIMARIDSRNVFPSKVSALSWILDHVPINDRPGATFSFSFTGYFILGMVIEKITGKSYEEWTKENILRPCGITDMEVEKDSSRNTYEVNHYKDLQWLQFNGDIDEDLSLSNADAALGWIASSRDLIKLMLKFKNADSLPVLRPPQSHPDYAPDWTSIHGSNNWWEQFDPYGTTSIIVRFSKGFCWAILINTSRPSMANYFTDIDSLINKTMNNSDIRWAAEQK